MGDVVKIDPPDISGFGVAELPLFTSKYISALTLLASDSSLRFLNAPKAIITALDKRATKKALLLANLPTPPALECNATCFEELLLLMEAARWGRVFVKPRFGSGAAAVSAFAYDFKHSRGVIYTSLAKKNGEWINTKKIGRVTDPSLCFQILNFVLSLDAVVEQWVPKPSVNGITFDLRVVWQLGKIEAIVARGSRGPITNLHLNDLALPTELVEEWIDYDLIEEICKKATNVIPGLSSAGLDLLCTPKGYQIIEINSQGDLIYRDIFDKNTIYSNQAQHLLKLSAAAQSSRE